MSAGLSVCLSVRPSVICLPCCLPTGDDEPEETAPEIVKVISFLYLLYEYDDIVTYSYEVFILY